LQQDRHGKRESPRIHYASSGIRDVLAKIGRAGGKAEKPLIFQMQAGGSALLASWRLSNMADETKKTYTIRLPEKIATQVETRAATMNVAPTALLQSLIARHFDRAGQDGPDTAALAALGGKLEALRKACERLERANGERYGQLLFEVVKTRSALFHSLDQTVGANAVDEIIEAAEQTARQYLARLDGVQEPKQ
jgi:hypothetical protein